MYHDVNKSLMDALKACRAMQEFSTGLTLESYQASRLHSSAIERQFGILGEAFTRVHNVDPSVSDRLSSLLVQSLEEAGALSLDSRGERDESTELKRIIGMRNRIIHGYDCVNDAIVWDAVQSRIPHLIRVLEEEIKGTTDEHR